jgi:hypothetical protein
MPSRKPHPKCRCVPQWFCLGSLLGSVAILTVMPFTATEFEQTKSVAGTFSLTMPYLAKNQPIPAPVVTDIRTLLIELGADGIVVGLEKLA